jgi:asparagine synthase (glutamine-hydrolysing)
MCGVSGIFSSENGDLNHIHTMVSSLVHRGPDAKGVFFNIDKGIALGHNRLSIIDLSERANQPMVSSDGRYVIVFNGEIYNFQKLKIELIALNKEIKFVTESDTEVILHAFVEWGEDMMKRLDGMFAIAIFDQQRDRLFIARDRVGKKPLFFYKDEKNFIFASEIKALLVHPLVAGQKKINTTAINLFLHLGYVPEPHTIFEKIHKFPAGSWAWLDKSINPQPIRYWKIEEEIPKKRSEDVVQSKSMLKEVLEGAVRKRLISDVPLGAFLSGGTDSSLVVAMACRLGSFPLKTFNIGFKESKFNESHWASSVAKHLKTEHYKHIISEKEGVDLLDKYLHHFDEPFADTSAIPTMLVSQLARKEVAVCLTGDGGDELFQGYGSYAWADRLNSWPWQISRRPLRYLLSISGSSRFQRVSCLLDDDSGNSYSHIFSQEQNLFSQKEIGKKLILDDSNFLDGFKYNPAHPNMDSLTSGEKQALFDFNYYLKDDLLVKVDRASMYYSLECRCPFLDTELIAWSCGLAATLKKQNGVSKWLLKELLSEYLPKDLVYRPKWGFSVPLSRWLKDDLRYLIDEFLCDAVVENLGLFNKSYVNKLKIDFLKGSEFLFNRIWVMIIIHKWLKENS